MFAICGGMPRSGSTLAYQIVCHLVERHLQGVRLGFVHAGLLPEFRQEVLDHRWRVVKSHYCDPGLRCLADEGCAVSFYVYRDLRDVVCSIMQHAGRSIQQPLSYVPGLIDNDRRWKATPGVLVQRYEDVFANVPAAITEMAAHLHVTLAAGEADEIAALYSLDANRARIQAISSRPGQTASAETRGSAPPRPRAEAAAQGAPATRDADGIDLHTLLLWNHIGSGRPGGWRETLSEADVQALRPACAEWLVANGYERDANWDVTPAAMPTGGGGRGTALTPA
jgi:hypothetical protein